jgi:hypothetical protein
MVDFLLKRPDSVFYIEDREGKSVGYTGAVTRYVSLLEGVCIELWSEYVRQRNGEASRGQVPIGDFVGRSFNEEGVNSRVEPIAYESSFMVYN